MFSILVTTRASLPLAPQLPVVVNTGSDVPFWLVNRNYFWVLGLDFLERRWHQLHDTTGTDPAFGVHADVAFRHGLRFEYSPVVTRPEEAFCIFPKRVVVSVSDPFGVDLSRS